MKIGINASFLRKPGTGIGQVTTNFLEKLVEFQISNFKFQNNDLNSKILNPESKIILYTEEPINLELPANFEVKSFLPKWWKRDDVPRKWLWERELSKHVVKDGCDTLLSLYQSATDFHAACVMPHDTPVRHVMIVHDIIPKLFPQYLGKWSQRHHWRAVERAIERADHIVAVSEATKSDLIWKLSLPANRISVAYPDAGTHFSVIPEEEKVADVLGKYHLEPGYIYHGGGLEVRKNTEGVLRAYAALLGKDTRNKLQDASKIQTVPKLVISGKVHAKSNKLATNVTGLIQELGLEEHVKLLGFVPDEDLPALYRGALCFAYPSLYEGFGLPALEAMRMGTPVLAAEVSSLPEVCGEAALYCDPESIQSIASGLERLLSDGTLRQTLSEKGIERSIGFSYRSFVENILEVCHTK